jgi:hypothetical protein
MLSYKQIPQFQHKIKLHFLNMEHQALVTLVMVRVTVIAPDGYVVQNNLNGISQHEIGGKKIRMGNLHNLNNIL